MKKSIISIILIILILYVVRIFCNKCQTSCKDGTSCDETCPGQASCSCDPSADCFCYNMMSNITVKNDEICANKISACAKTCNCNLNVSMCAQKCMACYGTTWSKCCQYTNQCEIMQKHMNTRIASESGDCCSAANGGCCWASSKCSICCPQNWAAMCECQDCTSWTQCDCSKCESCAKCYCQDNRKKEHSNS